MNSNPHVRLMLPPDTVLALAAEAHQSTESHRYQVITDFDIQKLSAKSSLNLPLRFLRCTFLTYPLAIPGHHLKPGYSSECSPSPTAALKASAIMSFFRMTSSSRLLTPPSNLSKTQNLFPSYPSMVVHLPSKPGNRFTRRHLKNWLPI